MPSQARPNVYSETAAPTNAAATMDFGFPASFLRVANDGPNPVYLNLKSSAGTTGDYQLSSGESFAGNVPPTSLLSYVASSSGGQLRVLALGG